MKLSTLQKIAIRDRILEEILKRGISTKMSSFKEVEVEGRKTRIEFITEPFQTIPVIFKEVRIGSFSSNIIPASPDEDNEIYEVFIGINWFYEHFDGGRNSCKMFCFSCKFSEGEDHIYNIQID